jgi:hypothetical protein
VKEAGRAIQHIQKALTTMNVQLGNVISDLSGVTGMAIVRAIVAGQRDPKELAKLRDRRIRASEEEIAHSLAGNWQQDVLFELGQVMEAYDFHQKQMAACDVELQKRLSEIPDRRRADGAGEQVDLSAKQRKKRKATRKSNDNRPQFDLGAELERLMGVDLRIIDGLDVMTAQTIYSELGPHLSAFPTEKQFAAWLGLSPRREVSGGKVIRHEHGSVKNRVANALRNAAQTLSRSDSYLGARYRQLRGRLGGLKAVKAMARYLACLIYRLLTKGQVLGGSRCGPLRKAARATRTVVLTAQGQHKGAEIGARGLENQNSTLPAVGSFRRERTLANEEVRRPCRRWNNRGEPIRTFETNGWEQLLRAGEARHAQQVKCAERQTEESIQYTQAPCSDAVRCLLYPQFFVGKVPQP